MSASSLGSLTLLASLLAAQERVPIQSDSAAATVLRAQAAQQAPFHYGDEQLPAHFASPGAVRFDNTPADNPITDAGATLGRFLFYETRLSGNNTLSCASCHDQSKAFADPNRVSRGFNGEVGERKAPNLVGLRYHPGGRFFWDERGRTLEEAMLLPIENQQEMGQKLEVVEKTLGADESYRQLFAAAFGDPAVNRERMAKAMAQFLRSIVSYRSRYDEGIVAVKNPRADFPNFTAQENRGKLIFERDCATCHRRFQTAHFNVLDALNNGLDDDTAATDGGVGDVTGDPANFGQFKSPGLRNVEVTGPYMHDGRLPRLDDVIEHYSAGVQPHPNLGGEGLRRFMYDEPQKAALLAFLNTLTDRRMLNDPKWSNPYVVPAAAPIATQVAGNAGMDAAQIARWLATFDADGDAALSEPELHAAYPVFEREGLTRDEEHARFGFRDRLPNQRHRGELVSSHLDHFLAGVERLDQNRDHVIDAVEVASYPRLLELGDGNRDMRLDRAEWHGLAELFLKESIPLELQPIYTAELLARSLAAGMRQADADHDGVLSRKEFGSDPRFADADVDGDGRIERQELEQFERAAVLDFTSTFGFEGLSSNRVYRALTAMDLDDAKRAELEHGFAAGRLNRGTIVGTRAQLTAALAPVLPADAMAKVTHALTETRAGAVAAGGRPAWSAPRLAKEIMLVVDRNRDSRLDGLEQRLLAARLEGMPGGFSVERRFEERKRLDDAAVVARYWRFDRDGNRRLAILELPERLRVTGKLADHDGSGDLDESEVLGIVHGPAAVAGRGAVAEASSRRSEEKPFDNRRFIKGTAAPGSQEQRRGIAADRLARILDAADLPPELRARAEAAVETFAVPAEPAQQQRQRLAALRQWLAKVLTPAQASEFERLLLEQEHIPPRPGTGG